MGKERRLVESIRQQTELMFYNLSVSMKTCNRDWLICGTPAWRYFYHTLHSCDQWFINPHHFAEPWLHVENMNNVDAPCDKVLTDKELWEYFDYVEKKTLHYLDGLSDSDLYDRPNDCRDNRLELIFAQFRHAIAHIGILNGITIAHTGKYPMVFNISNWEAGKLEGKLYDE